MQYGVDANCCIPNKRTVYCGKSLRNSMCDSTIRNMQNGLPLYLMCQAHFL